MSRIILFALCLAVVAPGGEDLVNDIAWVDGKVRTAKDFAGQGLVVIYFCGTCPTAGAYMNGTAKKLDAMLEAEKRPVRMLCITPNLDADQIKSWALEHKYVGALVGRDPKNRLNVGLQNIFQGRLIASDGKVFYHSMSADSIDVVRTFIGNPTVGSYSIPVSDLTSGPVRELWWACETGRPLAVRNLLAAEPQAKKSKDVATKSDMAVVATAVREIYARLSTELIAAAPSIEMYERLEALVTRFDGLDLKPVHARLKELDKDKQMKSELAARQTWRQCQAMLSSNRPTDQKAAKEALVILAKKYPDTEYGKRAQKP